MLYMLLLSLRNRQMADFLVWHLPRVFHPGALFHSLKAPFDLESARDFRLNILLVEYLPKSSIFFALCLPSAPRTQERRF
jgi:hypothetical protein